VAVRTSRSPVTSSDFAALARLRAAGIGLAVALLAAGARAGVVALDGVPLPEATSTVSIEREVTEYRDLEVCPRLLPGCTRARVCLAGPGPVAALDASLASTTPAQMSVQIEDGRSFPECLPVSLESEPVHKKRSYRYCLRCTGVSGP
jgi:hypothetical protein